MSVNPARGQLNRENWSRETGSAVPPLVSPLRDMGALDRLFQSSYIPCRIFTAISPTHVFRIISSREAWML